MAQLGNHTDLKLGWLFVVVFTPSVHLGLEASHRHFPAVFPLESLFVVAEELMGMASERS